MKLTDIKDILTMLFSIFALLIAYSGLKTWKKKLLGENKYELSIDVLKLLRVLIEEIESFRSPLFSIGELHKSFKEYEKKDPLDDDDFDKSNNYAMNLRWKNVISAYTNYDSKLLNLKVILDKYDIDVVNKKTMAILLKDLNNSWYSYNTFKKYLKPDIYQTQAERNHYMSKIEENGNILLKSNATNKFSISLENYFNEMKKRLAKYIK